MIEIVLHQVPGAQIEGVGDAAMMVTNAIFHAIQKEGTTTEELFEVLTIQAEFARQTLSLHQFFLAIASLLGGGFISASTRAVGRA